MAVDIKIDDKHYQVEEAVAQRMQDYWQASDQVYKELEKFTAFVRKVRNAQKQYFTSRDSESLRLSKALEKQLDDYLDGKTKKKEAAQQELFR